jgi:hypothetical protein
LILEGKGSYVDWRASQGLLFTVISIAWAFLLGNVQATLARRSAGLLQILLGFDAGNLHTQ